jgi:methyl-accepting chemotaxis protein
MTIGRKLTFSFAAMLTVTLVLAAVSLTAIDKLSKSLDRAVNITTKKIELIAAVSNARSDMLAAQRGVIMFKYSESAVGAEKAKRLFESAADQWGTSVSQIRPLLVTKEGAELTNHLADSLAAWRSAFAEIEQLTASGNPGAAVHVAVDKGVPIYDAAGRDSQRLQELQRGFLEKDKRSAAEIGSLSRWSSFALLAVSFVVGGLVLWLVRNVNGSLRRLASELGVGAEQLAGAASEVSSSSQALAEGSSEQAASLEETSATAEEINAMARRNSESSRSAAALVTSSEHKFMQTNRTLEQTVAAMAEINTQSGKISKIIKVIEEIAFQTNILALNAAVEAARAGEAGMGFAVVADEVRNLAQRCAQAAQDTAALIADSISKSNDGKTKVDQVVAAITDIIGEAGKVKTLVDEVNLGSEEQARGIEQMAGAITQMERVTQTTAANAEESAAAAEQLTAQSATLKDIVDRLTAMAGGDRDR